MMTCLFEDTWQVLSRIVLVKVGEGQNANLFHIVPILVYPPASTAWLLCVCVRR